MVSALYATTSPCKNVRTVGEVQEITHVDILNYDGSDNTNKETVDDDNIVYCNRGDDCVFSVHPCSSCQLAWPQLANPA